jgi:hypothetical protein
MRSSALAEFRSIAASNWQAMVPRFVRIRAALRTRSRPLLLFGEERESPHKLCRDETTSKSDQSVHRVATARRPNTSVASLDLRQDAGNIGNADQDTEPSVGIPEITRA